MTICSILGLKKKSTSCLSACCYAPGKILFKVEVEIVGSENVFQRGNDLYLKSQNEAGACILLDEETLECKLGDKRPFWCKQHDCRRDLPSYCLLHQEVMYYRQQNGLWVP